MRKLMTVVVVSPKQPESPNKGRKPKQRQKTQPKAENPNTGSLKTVIHVFRLPLVLRLNRGYRPDGKPGSVVGQSFI